MAIDFLDAVNVEKIASGIISKYHPHLVEASIKYLFRDGKWQKNEKDVVGVSKKVAGVYQYLTQYDFLIILNMEVWESSSPEEKQAILDHQLTHCGRGPDKKDGSPAWCTVDHDLEEFASVVKRNKSLPGSSKVLKHLKNNNDDTSNSNDDEYIPTASAREEDKSCQPSPVFNF